MPVASCPVAAALWAVAPDMTTPSDAFTGQIGEWICRIRTRGDTLLSPPWHLRPYLAPAAQSDTPADMQVDIHYDETRRPAAGFPSHSPHFIVEHPKPNQIRARLSRGLELDINTDTRHADVTITPCPLNTLDEQEAFRLNLRGAIEVPLALLCPELSGMLFHASAFSVPGCGAVMLLGTSGAGKSTNAQWALDRGWTVLGDDRVILQFTDSGPVVVPSPFVSEFRTKSATSDQMFPLKAIGILQRGITTSLSAMPTLASLPQVLRHAVQHRSDRMANEAMLDMAARLIGSATAYDYRGAFSPDNLSIWEATLRSAV